MHPRAPLWVHLVFPNAPKCRFSQIHPNAWCSKCIQMNNRSVENERSVENRSVGIWYLFRHPHQHHSIIACITWNHNQSSWFLIWWRLGSEKDTFQQGFNMSTDLFSFSTDLLLRQWCWLNTIGPNGERPIVPTMLTQHYWSKWRETYCSNDVEQLMHLLVIWALCTNGIDHLKGQLLFVTKHFKTLGQCLLTNTLFFWPDMWAQ